MAELRRANQQLQAQMLELMRLTATRSPYMGQGSSSAADVAFADASGSEANAPVQRLVVQERARPVIQGKQHARRNRHSDSDEEC
eukprot:774166-Pleurochrysis_carterae.AAC.1